MISRLSTDENHPSDIGGAPSAVCDCARAGLGGSMRRYVVSLSFRVAVLLMLATFACGHVAAGVFAQRFQYTQWTREQGLPPGAVLDIAQTPDGFLWVATNEGLARYDGVSFKILNRRTLPILQSDIITKLDVDAAARLWVATLNGGVYFKDAVGWHRVEFPAEEEELLVINLVSGAGDVVWVGTDRGLAKIRKSGAGYRLEPVASAQGKPVTFLGVLNGDTVWYVKREETGVWNLASGRRPAVGRNVPIDNPKKFARVWQVGNAIALFDWYSGIHLYGADSAPRAFRFDDVPDVSDVVIDRSGTLWVATLDRGLMALTANGEIVSFAGRFKGLDGVISDVFQARDGSIWIGTDKHGLIRLRMPEVEFFDSAAGKPLGFVNAVAESPQGLIYAAADPGIVEFSPEAQAFVPSAQNPPDRKVSAFGRYGDGGLVAVLPSAGLSDVESGRELEIDLSPIRRKFDIHALLPATDREIVAGTTYGVISIADGRAQSLEADGAGPMSIALLERRPGSIWVGSIDGLRLLENGVFVKHPHADALRGKWIIGLAPASSRGTWVATYGDGVYLIDGDKLRHYHEDVGLPRNNLNGLIVSRGYLWLLTSFGIYRIRESELIARDDRATGPIPAKLFRRAQGLAVEETTQGAHWGAVRARDGALWFATQGGVARIGVEAQSETGVAPSVHADEVRADGAFEWKGAEALNFAKGTRRIEIDVSAPDPVDGASIRIRHRIRDFDPGWVELRGGRTVHLGNLPPGAYALELQASDDEGRWRGDVRALKLRIEPHYYQTLWFKGLIALALLALAYAVHRARLSVLRARYAVMEERTRIAAELHDGVVQEFAGIALQMEVALADTAVADATAERMNLARRLALVGMDELRRSVRLLSAHPGQTLGAVESVRAALGQVSVPQGITLAFEQSGVPYGLEENALHHLDRIVRQAVANAIEHAQPANIRVCVTFFPQRFELTVEDDGSGAMTAAAADEGRGYGAVLLQKRAKAIGARLAIVSERGKGTRLKLTIPRRGLRGVLSWLRAE